MGILGSNEEHAEEFNKRFGEIKGQIQTRFAAPDMGGSGLWDGGQQGQLVQPVQPMDLKPTKSPRQAQQERQEKQKELLKAHQGSQNLIRKEIQQRIELVRDDGAYRLDFEKQVAQIVEKRKAADALRYGTEMRVALAVELLVEVKDGFIDPGFVSIGAAGDDIFKRRVQRDLKRGGAQCLG